MAQLITQFEKACSNVEPDSTDVKNAAEAHTAVRDVLDNRPDLVDRGIATVLIGSYKRHVSIRRVKDVDVFSRTEGLDMTAGEALDLFERILVEAFGEDRVERQDRSIKIDFPDFDLYVDAVPARPAGDYWEIPDRNNEWTQTNPEELTRLSSKMNDDNDDIYVPLVKLVRQTRNANLGKRPGGLYFEILTYHAFNNGVKGDNIAELYVATLRSIADQLEDVVNGGHVEDPTMPGAHIKIRVTDAQLKTAADKFAAIATKADNALKNDDPCAAAFAFREILGKNSDDERVFPMPAPCNDDGTKKLFATVSSTATAGDDDVPAGNRRFA
jgi:hypothetical protein